MDVVRGQRGVADPLCGQIFPKKYHFLKKFTIFRQKMASQFSFYFAPFKICFGYALVRAN